MERTIVKKRRNISKYEIGAFESYLSDMEKQGLKLQKLRNNNCYFETCNSNEAEYRVEIEDRSIGLYKKDLYREHGWSFVTECRGFGVFRADKDGNYREVYETKEEQQKWHESLIDTLRRKFISTLAGMLSLFIATCVYVFSDGTPAISLMKCSFLVFFEFMLILGLAVEGFRIRKALQEIKRGHTINHHESWKHLDHRNWVTSIISTLILVNAIAGIIYTSSIVWYNRDDHSMVTISVDTKLDCETVRLNDIEQYDLSEIQSDSEDDFYNNASEANLLFFQQYNVVESFAVPDEKLDGEVYSPFLKSYYYDVKIPFLCSGVFKDVLKEAKDFYDSPEDVVVEKLEDTEFDKAYCIKQDRPHSFTLVLQKENVTASFYYYGKHSMDEVLEAIANTWE